MEKIENLMKELSRKDFEAGQIQKVFGWTKDEFSGDTIPAFIDNIEDINQLVWNEFCVNNLAKYLLSEKNDDKIGVFLKGCDYKGFLQMVKDNRISQDKVIVYGVACNGMVDSYTGELYKKCNECQSKVPTGCQTILGEVSENKNSDMDIFQDVTEIENLSCDERFDYWAEKFSKCIRCNACRNICPACSCESCVFEKKNEEILGKANNESETGFYHITRAYHVAGRCSDCGECERVCPSGIPLSKINRKIIKDINELYPDEETDTLTSYNLEDKDTFSSKGGAK